MVGGGGGANCKSSKCTQCVQDDDFLLIIGFGYSISVIYCWCVVCGGFAAVALAGLLPLIVDANF